MHVHAQIQKFHTSSSRGSVIASNMTRNLLFIALAGASHLAYALEPLSFMSAPATEDGEDLLIRALRVRPAHILLARGMCTHMCMCTRPATQLA